MTTGHYVCGVKRKIYREDIKQAGLELMFLNGYNATGIKDITDRVSIPKGSFYNHFSSKEQFGLEVVQDYCDNGVRMYKRILLDSGGSPKERVERFVDHLITNYSGMDYKLGCVMSNFSAEMSDVNENFKSLLDEQFDECQNVMAACIQQGQEVGQFKSELDANQAAAFMLNSLHGGFVRMKTTGNGQPLEDFKKHILILLNA